MTEFIAEKFVAEGKPTDSFVLRIVTGSLRVISGWIAHTNRAGHHIATPSATIGIRGTDHEPFVLSEELATATGNREGTYDKVNRGGTTMQVGEQKLDIDPGKVGFVRAPGKPIKQRGMMTLLLPVLLDKVPNFYVPGKFDAELDTYSLNADKESLRQLKLKRKSEITSSIKECAPAKIANTWLAQLDKAIIRHDAPAIIDMFSPDVSIQATVHGNDGNMVSIDLERDEFVKSTIEAMKGLTEYKQRRMWTEAKQEASSSENACDRIKVKTLVSEQGRQSGKPYRFKSLEEHTLELREGKWLSINTRTTQQ